jgi:hypothetical protein
MLLQRRTFVRDLFRSGVTLGLIAAGAKVGFAQKPTRGQVRVPVDPALGIPVEAQRDPVFWFTFETFEPYVGGIFQAPNSLGKLVELRLESCTKYLVTNKLTKRAGRTDSFSLLFKASEGLPPFTSIHSIKHPALGEFDLFLTPLKGQDGEFLYEAIINHVRR